MCLEIRFQNFGTIVYFAYRIINIVNAFTPFCLLHHCQSKATEKVSSNDEFVYSSATVEQASAHIQSL